MQKKYMFGLLFMISLGLFIGTTFSGTSDVVENIASSEKPVVESVYCFTHTDEFGNLKASGCTHNTLMDTGADMIRDLIGVGGGTAALPLNISLCNATLGSDSNGCSIPTSGDSSAEYPFTGCGLIPIQGLFTSLGQVGNWTVSNTFISTCDNVIINTTYITNSTGTPFSGAVLSSSTTLQTNDQFTLNATFQASGS